MEKYFPPKSTPLKRNQNDEPNKILLVVYFAGSSCETLQRKLKTVSASTICGFTATSYPE